jgi:Holliday junction resolvasome RuvABC endonuclease subunit
MTILGIDLSLTSPGLVVQSENEYTAYFYACRKRDNSLASKSFAFDGGVFHLKKLQDQEQTDNLFGRYDVIVRDILRIVETHDVKHVVIEGYAFSAQSSSTSKLFELGGIVRYSLWRKNITFEDIAPTRVKKMFTGCGKADKLEMWKTFHKIYKFPDLRTIFKVHNCKDVAHPVQDIVDAVALIFCKKTNNK